MYDALHTLRKISILAIWILAVHLPALAQAPQAERTYLRLSAVPSRAQRFLLATGTRLRRPGKERIVSAGTLVSNSAAPSPIEITWELPQKIRIDQGRGTVIFDRANPAQPIPPERAAADLIETFLEDSLEGFFARENGRSVRFLGKGFHAKTDGPDGPSYEIVELWIESRFRNGAEPTIKQYWFDSRTKLLSRVVYRVGGSSTGFVEVFWSDWRDVNGEKLAFQVERKEAGQTTLQLTVESALVSQMADDGRFSGR